MEYGEATRKGGWVCMIAGEYGELLFCERFSKSGVEGCVS